MAESQTKAEPLHISIANITACNKVIHEWQQQMWLISLNLGRSLMFIFTLSGLIKAPRISATTLKMKIKHMNNMIFIMVEVCLSLISALARTSLFNFKEPFCFTVTYQAKNTSFPWWNIGCVVNHILMLFTSSKYYNSLHKVLTVAYSMHTIGRYYSAVIVCLNFDSDAPISSQP